MCEYCNLPFIQFDVQDKVFFPCCGAWCNYYQVVADNVSDAWYSKEMQEFRRTILDGSYKYCSDLCPLKGIFKPITKNTYQGPNDPRLTPSLECIKVCSDYTCNLKCKMCRDRIIITDPRKVVNQLNQIEQEFGNTLKVLELSGCGDPIASKPMLRWLQFFDPKRFPNLECIRLDTNMQLLTPELWKTLERVRPFVRHFNISIDAATKETYEKVRRGGSWDALVENCRYVVKNLDVQEYHISFCICKDNLQEIERFYYLCKEMFPKNLTQILYQEVLWFPERVSKASFEELSSFTEEDINIVKKQLEAIKGDKVVRVQSELFN